MSVFAATDLSGMKIGQERGGTGFKLAPGLIGQRKHDDAAGAQAMDHGLAAQVVREKFEPWIMPEKDGLPAVSRQILEDRDEIAEGGFVDQDFLLKRQMHQASFLTNDPRSSQGAESRAGEEGIRSEVVGLLQTPPDQRRIALATGTEGAVKVQAQNGRMTRFGMADKGELFHPGENIRAG